MILRKAKFGDLEAVCEVYRTVSDTMESEGLHQWHWGVYPSADVAETDIRKGHSYVTEDEQGICGVICLNTELDPEYDNVNWLFGVRPGAFHRIAVLPRTQGKGIGKQMLADAQDILRGLGCDTMRFDTWSLNTRAVAMYDKLCDRRAGEVHFFGRKEPFICFEKRLTPEAPLLPLRMHPAFRGGKLTPWGGERLKNFYKKPVTEPHTGESLEVSCIPGLESCDDTGVKLPDLIRAYGRDMVGCYADRPFPLLLKLIDSADMLSVQVHPDDAYAAVHENGKLGKTEAWLIMNAPEGAELIYGVVPGTDKTALRKAAEAGAEIQQLLRRVPVHAGDFFYIPAGCVHAIGPGISLYEIQQSSDITYRFYDWDRMDAKGNKRELHLDKALDVTDVDCYPPTVEAFRAEKPRVLENEYFTMDLLQCKGETKQVPPVHEFAILTALGDSITLRGEGFRIDMKIGDTVFVPAKAPALQVEGAGYAAVAMPR